MATPACDPASSNQARNVKQMEPLCTAPRLEQLKAYNLNLDRINQLINPDYEDERWRVQKVLKHRLVSSKGHPERVLVKVLYADQVKGYLPLDTLRTHDPLIALMYAKDKDLLKDPYWEWTQYYLDDNPCTNVLLNIYKAASSPTEQGGKTFKFEHEVPKNAKHALAMDKAAGKDDWAKSMGLELGQLNDFKVFKVLPDDYILPKEYKCIPYQIVFDVKFDR